MSESIQTLINSSRELLPASDSPRIDCELLLCLCLGQNRAQLIARSDQILTTRQYRQLCNLLKRRQEGEPIAYIQGFQEFCGRSFMVDRHTLIPRPDTELLVEIILDRFDPSPRKVIDLGTGSGALAVTIKQERRNWQVLATDISAATLNMAKQNTPINSPIDFLQGNWLDCIDQACIDLIVANPPYIASTDPHLTQLRFEPRNALVSAGNGLRDLATIIEQSVRVLSAGGSLLLEHGYSQQPEVENLMKAVGFVTEKFNDLNDQPRAMIGYRE